MMGIHSRHYQGDDDYHRLRSFVTEIYPLVTPNAYCTVGDLDWWRGTDDDQNAILSARLWFDRGKRIVGFGWPWPKKRRVDLMVHPDYRACEPEMLE